MMLLAFGLIYTLIAVTLKATILLALVATIAFLARRASSAFRHLVWALGLGCVLLLPLLSWNIPHWHIPITIPATHIRSEEDEAMKVASVIAAVPTVTQTTDPRQQTSTPLAAAPTASPALPHVTSHLPIVWAVPVMPPFLMITMPLRWIGWALIAWVIGVIFVMARLFQGLAALSRIARMSAPITVGPTADAADAAAKVLEIGRRVALRQASSTARVTVPLTYGAVRPIIILPTNAQDWPEERLRAALLHEMGHVRRNDWALQMIAHVAHALYWFHPVVCYAERRMRSEAETACDDLVLGAGVPPTDYARHLLDVAMGVRQSRGIGWGAVAMAQSPRVEKRLRAVLAQGLSRRPATTKTVIGLFVAAILVALPMATLSVSSRREAVSAADHLQLQDDFTLRYEVTITDLRSRQPLFSEYTQMRTQYQQLLKKYPHYQPIPEEAQKSFAYFLSRRPRTRHLLMIVSARDGRLLYRTIEGSNTYTWVYDGRSSALNWNGHTGQTDAGLMFDSDFSLPAVGLPHIPLIKTTTLLNSVGNQQTWMVDCPSMGSVGFQGAPSYFPATVHAVNDEGIWKLLDIDDGNQRFEYLRHQQFDGLRVASEMTTTRYTVPSSVSPTFPSQEALAEWVEEHRTATSINQYRLLSASSVPLSLVDFDKPSVERSAINAAYAAGIRRNILHWPSVWRVVKGSAHDSTQVQRLDVHDHTAQAVVLEDDRAIVTDPRSGRNHSVESTATFNDFWRLTPKGADVSTGWVLEKGRAEGQKNTMDGRSMDLSTGPTN